MIPPLRRSAPAALRAFFEAGEADARFREQLALRYADLTRLFDRLYGSRLDRDVHLERLLQVLLRRWNERPDALRVLDDRRVRAGAWYADGSLVAMQLYVDRFCGSIGALGDELDYFEDLGVNLVHIMPVLETPAGPNDGGYAVSDYLRVRAGLGTLDDVAALAAEMHRRGIALAFDFVLNHTSDEHEWARRALAGDPAYRDYYHIFSDRTIPDVYDDCMPEVFPLTAPGNFTFRTEIDAWVMTVFHHYQWDLNYTNPTVLIEIIDTLLQLANVGIDVFRLDAVPFLWKRLGTSGRNLPEAHVIARLIHVALGVSAPGVITTAEAIVQPKEIVRYFGEGEWAGRECELAYNAGLMVLLWDAIATGKPSLLRRGLAGLPNPPSDTAWLNYVRCHDDIGLGYDEDHIRAEGWDPGAHRDFMIRYFTGEFAGSTASGARFMDNPRTGDARISGTAASLAGLERAEPGSVEEAQAIARVILLHAVILSIAGIPVIYSGDEIAVTNDYSYLDSPSLASDNRWMHRPHVGRDQRDARMNARDPAHRVFSALRALIAVRSRCVPLCGSAPSRIVSSDNPHLLAFTRTSGSERVLMIANFNSAPAVVPQAILRAAGFSAGIDIAHGRSWPAVRGDARLDGYEFVWLSEESRTRPFHRST